MRMRAARLEVAIRSVLWDQSAGAYRDSRDPEGKFGTLSEGTNANALEHLEPPGASRAAQILESIFVQRKGNPIQASPFMMNVVLDALSRHSRADLVFPMLAARYPAQVESGSTWEHWRSHSGGGKMNPTANSLSHAWGAGPLAFFVNTVVGIRPTAPGWRAIRIAPQPGPLTRAEAGVETAAGRIFGAWEVEQETFRLRVELPQTVEGTCRLPNETEVHIPFGGGHFACKLRA